MTSVRVGTRGSALAWAQATQIVEQLKNLHRDVDFQMIAIRSEGDTSTTSLAQIGGQGVFTQAISEALAQNKIDIAIHSLKDLPTTTHPELTLGAIPKREDPRDVLISKNSLNDFAKNATIGTGSLRRKGQLLNLRSDFHIVDIRGNVDTRLGKVLSGEMDGIVLAAAGLNRLKENKDIQDKLQELSLHYFDFGEMVPAVGQGALGIECRADKQKVLDLLSPLNHLETRQAAECERRLLSNFGGGCQVPFAAHVKEAQCFLYIYDTETGKSHHAEGSSQGADDLFKEVVKKSDNIKRWIQT